MQENSPEMDLRFLLHSEKRDPNPIVREQALKSGSRKRKENRISLTHIGHI